MSLKVTMNGKCRFQLETIIISLHILSDKTNNEGTKYKGAGVEQRQNTNHY